MRIEVRVPTLSDSVASGALLPWRKLVGNTVARDETLVDLETDKVILEIPAPASGTLVEIARPEGAVVKADEVIAVIETGEGASTDVMASAPKGMNSMKPSGVPAEAPPAGSPRPAGARDDSALPKATVTPTPSAVRPLPRAGEGGKAESTPMAAPPHPNPPPQAGERPDGHKGANAGLRPPTPIRREPMSRLRQRVAERLVAAQHTAAMLTTFNEVNMQPVNELRQRFKAEFEVKHGVKLGYMSFFVRAACKALEAFPVVNAAIDGSDIVWHADADIGIAISTPRGLVVPILRRAQTLSSAAIEAAIADFAGRAKEGRLTLEELAGGTFSITNGGVFGSLLSTPILNPPQSAILGMHAIQERPVAEHGQVVIRPMMYLALTYDHRLIDGRDAVQFLVALKTALESPQDLLQEF
jgi:2-oxoglutarate dehydrogenase E2 component (dihydrolipoamide succinyltransferase)